MKPIKSSDGGSALVVVILMVVILSLWFGSVAMLVQSTNAAVTNSSRLTEARSAQLNKAFAYALQKLTPITGGVATRLGSDPALGSGYTNLGCSDKILGYPSNASPEVDIYCTQATGSGGVSQNILGPLFLVGKTGTVGVDQGLAITGGAASCPSSTSLTTDTLFAPLSLPSATRFITSSGIVNVSGAWSGVSCNSFGVLKSGTTNPEIVLPDTASCPATWYSYTKNASGGTYSADQSTAGVSAQCVKVSSATLDPDLSSGSSVATAMGTLASQAPSVSASASFVQATTPLWTTTGTAASGGYDSFGQWSCAASGPCRRFIEVRPGVIDEAFVTKLNALTCAACGAGASYGAIVLLPGVYKFTATTAWTIAKSQFVVIGGKPNWSSMPADLANSSTNNTLWSYSAIYNSCQDPSTNPNNGVQLQFSGSSSIVLTNGRMILCGDPSRDLPVIYAPTQAMQSSGYSSIAWTGTTPLITANSACANGGQNLIVRGKVFAPAGSLDLNLCQYKSLYVTDALVTKAIKATITSSVVSLSQASPPATSPSSYATGNRVVQLKFVSKTLGYLGTVQVRILDNGGANIASGYQILSWRSSW